MKITEFGPVGRPGSVSKKNTKKVGSDFGSMLESAEAAENSDIPEVSSTSSINMIDSLIAVQQMEVEYGDSKEAVDHGKHLLDFLDDIKGGVLDGAVSLEKLQRLRNGLKKERGWVIDDKLSSVLNEIETRAKVEIAKIDPKSE